MCFVRLHAATYDVTSAVEVSAAAVESIACVSAHVNGWRVQLQDDLLVLEGAVDRTSEFRQALGALDCGLKRG